MKLTMLGTGNANVTKCYNTCFILLEEDKGFLVDAGGGNQILKILDDVDIPLESIHDIFVTHEHTDHLLGVIWLIRIVGQMMYQGKYNGELHIYCFPELADKIKTICNMIIQQKVCKYFDNRIIFKRIMHGETQKIIGKDVTFFDIYSTKTKQFGFSMKTSDETKLTCIGDEPYNKENYEFVKDSQWLLHEAFCLYSEADIFKPYEKNHSTVKDACRLAEEMKIPNLLLYHTEEKNLENRKALYMAEGRKYYSGNLYVPNDLESFTIS